MPSRKPSSARLAFPVRAAGFAGLLAALPAVLVGLGAALAAPQEPAPAPAPDTQPIGPLLAGEPPPPSVDRGVLPAPVYDLTMEATYDAEEAIVRGTQKLRWRNTASVPVADLQFHLYLNAFANDRSTFMVESGGQLRGDEFDEERWGYAEVAGIRLADGTDLKPTEEFLQPDDGNPEDRTVVRYRLPQPVPPGGTVEVDLDFESKLPTIFARTGAHGEYVLGGQWFPKIAVFEDAGQRDRKVPGWNARQFHANSEFYADFGDYDVTLTLPARYAGKIGATGRRVSEEIIEASAPEGQVKARFVQQGVHDFAWTADPRFLVLKDRFDPAKDVSPERRARIAALLGVPEREIDLTPVDIELYLSPAHASQAGRYFESAKAALEGYGLRLGAYPYETLTLVDPPKGAGGSGGMEYPTFITLGTSPLLAVPPFRKLRAPELVTVHEFGHQFFQGMIANNEFEEAWIDEGINSFYEMTVMDDVYRFSVELPTIRVSNFEFQRAGLGERRFSDPIAAPAWRYRSGGSYAMNSYSRPAVTLRHLQNLLGDATFHRAMRAFFQEWRFRHPTTADFEASIERAAGRDLDWFFSQALHSARVLDYSVARLSNDELNEPRGWFWQAGERVELGKKDEDGDDDEDEEQDDDEAKRWKSSAVVRRLGEFQHPVTVEFRFENDRVERRTWDGRERWARWDFEGPDKLESVEVDPERLLALEGNRLDNSLRDEPDRRPALALSADLLAWIQHFYHALSFFG